MSFYQKQNFWLGVALIIVVACILAFFVASSLRPRAATGSMLDTQEFYSVEEKQVYSVDGRYISNSEGRVNAGGFAAGTQPDTETYFDDQAQTILSLLIGHKIVSLSDEICNDDECKNISGIGINAPAICGDKNEFLLGTKECVSYTPSVTYLPTSVETAFGTDFNNNDVNAIEEYDGIFYSVHEASGSPGLVLDVNFSGVTNFSSALMKEWFDDDGHEIIFKLWDYDSNSWDTYASIESRTTVEERTVNVGDPACHISLDGLVQARFEYSGNGNPSYNFYLDYLWLQSGPVISTLVHDSLVGLNTGDFLHLTPAQLESFGAVGDEYFVWDATNKRLLIGVIDSPKARLDVRGSILVDGGDYSGEDLSPFPGNDNVVMGDWSEGCYFWPNEDDDDYSSYICNVEGVITIGTKEGYYGTFGNDVIIAPVPGTDQFGKFYINETDGVKLEHPTAGTIKMTDAGIVAESAGGGTLTLTTAGCVTLQNQGEYFTDMCNGEYRVETDGDNWHQLYFSEERGGEFRNNNVVMNIGTYPGTSVSGVHIAPYAQSGYGSWNWKHANLLNVVGDINASGANGFINADTNFQVNGVPGITDNSSYWLCTASDCSTSCQVTLSGGIVTGCA